MATTAESISMASLPSKKRKPSNASSDSNRSMRPENSRLPSKKRKGSLDSKESHTMQRPREYSVSFDDDYLPRKESLDSSLLLDILPRKFSTDSSAKLDDLLATTLDPTPVLLTSRIEHSDLMQPSGASTSALDHLDALGKQPAAETSKRKNSESEESSAATFASSGHRLLVESMMSNSSYLAHTFGSSARRDRLESWGGMSDLSIPIGSAESAVAARAASALHYGQWIEDPADARIPTRISLERDRLNSVASLSETSFGALMVDGLDLSDNLQAFVAAAVASFGDQLADVASAVEAVVDNASLPRSRRDTMDESETSSVASPLIGATSDRKGRPRTWSTSSRISVDLDAVQAALDAAQAASSHLNLESLGSMAPPASAQGSSSASAGYSAKHLSRRLPLKRDRGESQASSTSEDRQNLTYVPSTISPGEMERIRERARAAAGYVQPPDSIKKPIKKRAKRDSPETSSVTNTPKVSNSTITHPDDDDDLPYAPLSATSDTPKAAKGQASQKWEDMFECLLDFIEERKQEETNGCSEKSKDWIWDGNVPTTYKSKSGKALGRWVNNQRTAKSKGTLKHDREQRLVDAGLKWTVLASNSWNGMLEELRIYISEQTKNGGIWDGNVPTNYQIKTRPGGLFSGEDKNLGRWVNRQRSMYQAGKLRKDRQEELEKIGLKWSMLATTSWDSMFETLQRYVKEQKAEHGSWDGNVTANYKTNDTPPRALGRWINRQRSAYVKGKLKKEYVEKLSSLGLKWVIHQRQDQGDNETGGPEEVPSNDVKEAGSEDDGSLTSRSVKKLVANI